MVHRLRGAQSVHGMEGREMTRRIRALSGGRARVWWVHRGQDVIRAAQLAVVVALWLLVSHYDYQDALDAERGAYEAIAQERDALARQVEEMGAFSQQFPRVVFVVEARDRNELNIRLAEIAGDLDAARARK